MWEAYELGDEDVLWSGTGFLGGIAGYQHAPCGAVSAFTLCLGLYHRVPLDDEEKAEQARGVARSDIREVVKSFIEKYGTIGCRDLIGFDFSDEEARSKFRESGMRKETCDSYVQFAVEKLYELYER